MNSVKTSIGGIKRKNASNISGLEKRKVQYASSELTASPVDLTESLLVSNAD
jgi:hypothetical protein